MRTIPTIEIVRLSITKSISSRPGGITCGSADGALRMEIRVTSTSIIANWITVRRWNLLRVVGVGPLQGAVAEGEALPRREAGHHEGARPLAPVDPGEEVEDVKGGEVPGEAHALTAR